MTEPNQNALATQSDQQFAIMEQVLVSGDLSKLTPQQRSDYILQICKSTGLNPLTKPFDYIVLNNKLTLYVLKSGTEQLRHIHKISITDMKSETVADVYRVTVYVTDSTGRTDVATGAVSMKNLTGDGIANAIMKAETKAKRRATLSICGLGFLDESELESIPDTVKKPVNTKPVTKPVTSETTGPNKPLLSDQAPEKPEKMSEQLQETATKREPLPTTTTAKPANTVPANAPITKDQLTLIHVLYNKLGITGREERLAHVAKILSVTCESSTQLLYGQAQFLIGKLQMAVVEKDQAGKAVA